MSDRSAAQILVSGIVQGVNFRHWTQRTAQSLGLAGWVRNLHDGRVEVYAEGPEGALAELEQACWDGPPAASVENVAGARVTPRGSSGFGTAPTAAGPEPL